MLARPSRSVAIGTVLLAASLVAAAAPWPARAHDKTDVVTLINGDVLTGEIKGLSRGQLTLSTDSSPQKIYLKWEWVTAIKSSFHYELEDVDGIRYFGTLPEAEDRNHLVVRTARGDVTLNLENVVNILPISRTFWSRFSGDVGLSFGYSQINTVIQWNGNATIKYVSRKWDLKLNASSFFSSQKDAAETTRHSTGLNATRNLPRRWLVAGAFLAEESPDQGYDPRLSLGGSFGRYLIKENHQILSVNLGVSVVGERAVGADSYSASSELGLPVKLERFFYERPKRDLAVHFTPSLSLNDTERYRVNLTATGRWETLKNLYIELTLQESYDAKPPGGDDAAKNDLTLTTGVSYSFP